ncbi:hypothetical protein F511_13992 [Dorcoceras hygrometricum]|uniref:WRKY19-like zinc finger domain-containing protein n=1 Tax=Dorcoceras hygrometricum TaxID=472368 RepID=A0A2Z7C284_9LAMI|nr:hypothetical protein F511_13992 [Dorcoceras hygrometricum]
MDGIPDYATLPSASKDLERVLPHTTVSAVHVDSPVLSSSLFSGGCKRKCNDVNGQINLRDGSPLALGLGLSSTSCTTTCSGNELGEESSINLGLSISLNRGDDMLHNSKRVSDGCMNSFSTRKPALDLQLSLSTRPPESDVTTLNHGLFSYPSNFDPPSLTSTVQLVDEGSTSSPWNIGPLVPLSQNFDSSALLYLDHGYVNPNHVIQKHSSSTLPPSLVGTSSDLSNQQHKKSVKSCKFEGCTRGARGASGLCIAHGGGRRCQRAGCQKGAEGKTAFCKAHGGGRRCQQLGCTKSAEGRTEYCISHGGGRRCSHENCNRAARGKSDLCIRHGGGKRCKMENCSKSAEGIYGLCISHGGGRRCQYPDCKKGAQGSTMFCKAHGGGRRCTSFGCTKGAEGSTPYCKGHGGGKRCTSQGCTKSVHGGTLFCVRHGGGKRCAVPECTKSARGRTDYCVRHGGGKRCQFEGCPKSAQGSTDFCKAHGGGRRCSWGQLGSEFGGPFMAPCDKFARGKSGLCAAHSAQFPTNKPVKESSGAVSTTNDTHSATYTQRKDNSADGDALAYPFNMLDHGQFIPPTSMPSQNFTFGNALLNHHLSLPEGRVHGGSLMAMLKGGSSNNNQEIGGDESGDPIL